MKKRTGTRGAKDNAPNKPKVMYRCDKCGRPTKCEWADEAKDLKGKTRSIWVCWDCRKGKVQKG